MTRDALWAAYVARNPAFAGSSNVTLSAAGLRKLFDQTWEKAEAHGRAAAGLAKGPFDGIFDDFLGRKGAGK